MGAADAPGRVFYASRRKRWRGALMVLAALGVGAFLVSRQPPLDMSNYWDIALVATTWIGLIWVAATGIERCFEQLPTLRALPEGLVLFPTSNRQSVIPWSDITRIEVYRFFKSRWAARFLSLVVDDPRKISRHLPLHLRIAYCADRWVAGDNRYFRPASDFDVPVTQVVEEIEAWRIASSDTRESENQAE